MAAGSSTTDRWCGAAANQHMSDYALVHRERCYAPAPGEPFGLLSQGMFGYTKTDLTVAAPIPIVIARVYRDGDLSNSGTTWNVRDFGIGTSLNYDLYLYSGAEVKNQANPYANISVVLPDGADATR